MVTYTPSHLSFPTEFGVPGFLIPIFVHDDQLVVQYITADLNLTFVPVQPSDEYVNVAAPGKLSIRFLDDDKSAVLGEPIHAFFDGEIIIVGKESRLVSYLRANLALLYAPLAKTDPYVLAGVYDFLGAHPQADQIRATLNAGKPIAAKAMPLGKVGSQASPPPVGSHEVRGVDDNQTMLRQVRGFGRMAADSPTAFRAVDMQAETA